MFAGGKSGACPLDLGACGRGPTHQHSHGPGLAPAPVGLEVLDLDAGKVDALLDGLLPQLVSAGKVLPESLALGRRLQMVAGLAGGSWEGVVQRLNDLVIQTAGFAEGGLGEQEK